MSIGDAGFSDGKRKDFGLLDLAIPRQACRSAIVPSDCSTDQELRSLFLAVETGCNARDLALFEVTDGCGLRASEVYFNSVMFAWM
jgi:hypothetical protein